MYVHFDMETQDPDDVFTLCLLATHPRVVLRGVTLFPGGRDQVGVVKHILRLLGKPEVPVGADIQNDGKSRVSGFHYKWLGPIEPRDPDISTLESIKFSVSVKDCTLLTGAPLRNIHRAHEALVDEPWFIDWVCQGGFAGANIVPPESQLEKFKGLLTCPTFNLNGDPKAALVLLTSPRMRHINMVSKNVCHGCIFGPQEAEKLPKGAHAGLDLLLEGMQVYFQKVNPKGKALHDTIAAGLMLHPRSANWVQGEPYREKGKWGFRSMQELYGDSDLWWPKDVERFTRYITIGLNSEAIYQSWVE